MLLELRVCLAEQSGPVSGLRLHFMRHKYAHLCVTMNKNSSVPSVSDLGCTVFASRRAARKLNCSWKLINAFTVTFLPELIWLQLVFFSVKSLFSIGRTVLVVKDNMNLVKKNKNRKAFS